MKHKVFIWRILADISAALLCVGVFLLFYYVLPWKQEDAGTVILDAREQPEISFELPAEESGKPSRKAESRGSARKTKDGGRGMGNGNSRTRDISSDGNEAAFEELKREEIQIADCRDDTMQISIKKVELGEGDDRITYYAADVYLTSAGQLRTAFAKDSYGKNIRESTLQMAEDHQAVLAVSGDSYGNSETGVVVRNGILYRSETNDAEICVLFYDGTMQIYEPEDFDVQELSERDVWQVWNFGPSLLEDGEVKETFLTNSYLNGTNPRCAIGYVASGHYKFVLVDGRNVGYSRGATLSELAGIMKEEGCRLAYNLDGGKSAAMVYQGSYVNQPAGGGRDISDIIYIGKENRDE